MNENPLNVDCTIILSLDKREEMWRKLTKQCEERGWLVKNFVVGSQNYPHLEYDRVDEDISDDDVGHIVHGRRETRRHHYFAFLSHRAIANYALEKGYKKILIMEDDSLPLWNRFDLVLDKLKKKTVNLVWDIILLGWWIGSHRNDFHVKENVMIERMWYLYGCCDIKPSPPFGGFHGIVLNENVMKYMITLKPGVNMEAQLSKKLDDFKCYYVIPKIITVSSGWSECEGRFVERDVL